MQRKTIFLLVIALFMVCSLFAGTTGKLAGKVKNQDGELVEFANVFIASLEVGAQTNAKGQFIIINIEPGVYDVSITAPGYQPQTLTGVKINLDETTMQNFVMNRMTYQLEGMKVTAARTELVSKNKTSSGNIISSETIDDIAVGDIEGIVAIQAGASVVDGELHVRGGRPNEVVFSIDGMSVSDPVDGGAALNIDTDAIQDMKVMTGGFSAEFGNAQSGIVNIITKSGSDNYSGKVEFASDHLISETNSNSDLIKFSLGGPVLGALAPSLRKSFTFFFNGSGNWYDSFYKDLYDSNPNDDFPSLVTSWSDFEAYDPYKDREEIAGFDLGDRNFNSYNGNLKIKYKFNSKTNVTFALRGDKNSGEGYNHTWKYALKHFARSESSQNQYIVTFDHVFNPQMNLQLKASMYKKETNQAPNGIARSDFFGKDTLMFDILSSNYDSYEDITGINYLTTDGFVGSEQEYNWTYETEDANEFTVPFTKPGAISGTFIDDQNEEMALKGDFEYQINQIHGLKTGFEVKKHNIKKDRLFSPWQINSNRFNDYLKTVSPEFSYSAGDTIMINGSEYEVPENKDFYSIDNLYDATLAAAGEADGYESDPWQGAFYVQDKMEWEGMIVNAGVRFDVWYLGGDYDIITPNYTGSYLDYINPDSDINSDYYIPDADPITDPQIYEEYHNAKDYYKIIKDKFETPEVMVSPRLGISHPISEKSVVHFAYNYQRQLPQMQYVFTTGRPQDLLANPSLNLIIGNPELEAQTTVTYEAGLSHQLSENYVLDVTTYYKNIYNYVSTTEDSLGDFPYNQYSSEDYGSARGIDINLQKIYSDFISGSASYSLTWANGNHSETNTANSESLREFPLNWDIRNSFNLNLTFKIPRYEEFIIPFTDVALPFDDFSANFGYNLSSGRPYTEIDENDISQEQNDEKMPATETASLKLKKNFSFGEKNRFSIYFNINNLFNKRNYYSIYGKTGSPYYSGTNLDTDNDGYVAPEQIASQNLIDNSPRNYSVGRNYTIGVSFNW